MSIFGGNKGTQQQNSSANPSSNTDHTPVNTPEPSQTERGREWNESIESRHGMSDDQVSDMVDGNNN